MRDCTGAKAGLVLLFLLCSISHLHAAEQLEAKRPKAAHTDTLKKNTQEEPQQNKASQTENIKKANLNGVTQELQFDDRGKLKLPDGWVDPLDMMEFDLTKRKPNFKAEENIAVPDEDPEPKLPPTTADGKCSAAARNEMEQLLEDCRNKKGRYKKASELCQQQLDDRPVNREPLFRQFIKQFVDKIHKDGDLESSGENQFRNISQLFMYKGSCILKTRTAAARVVKQIY